MAMSLLIILSDKKVSMYAHRPITTCNTLEKRIGSMVCFVFYLISIRCFFFSLVSILFALSLSLFLFSTLDEAHIHIHLWRTSIELKNVSLNIYIFICICVQANVIKSKKSNRQSWCKGKRRRWNIHSHKKLTHTHSRRKSSCTK